ncbi:uncharacterized protein LOC124442943 isoform X2 [Xenia sp. Carnegie-2017]|uniref:uncharacterized protein LOC124442943 isoform X2 n=1 Tax=Xenia sp. Carnegie-2017 TaxID=2897299 RepID=UPI001F044104|nr:uncharacterized protein LOC124442943 isoform X2 [Xenia sp. Carnegie-2017]
MKLLSAIVFLTSVGTAASLYCRCTKEHCDHDKLPTCYTVNSCFTKTIKGNISAGCVHSSNFEVWLCDLKHASTTYNCCKTDNCNHVGLSPLHYLPDDFRSKIDGYVATLHTPGERGRIFQNLPVNTKEFTYDELAVGKRYVIEVTAYREKLSSKPSNSVIIKTKTPECDYFKIGDTTGTTSKKCSHFGCFSIWKQNATNLQLQQKGCWNDVEVSSCINLKMTNVTHIFCLCNKRTCQHPSTST